MRPERRELDRMLERAKKAAQRDKQRPLGQILIEMGAITQEQLDKALAKQQAMAEPEPRAKTIEEEAPVIRIINVIIEQAIKDRATHAHITPDRRGVHVHYRIDGVLHDIMTIPKYVHAALVARFKMLAGCKGGNKREEQKGQINFSHGGREYQLKATFTPTDLGERIVIAIPK